MCINICMQGIFTIRFRCNCKASYTSCVRKNICINVFICNCICILPFQIDLSIFVISHEPTIWLLWLYFDILLLMNKENAFVGVNFVLEALILSWSHFCDIMAINDYVSPCKYMHGYFLYIKANTIYIDLSIFVIYCDQ